MSGAAPSISAAPPRASWTLPALVAPFALDALASARRDQVWLVGEVCAAVASGAWRRVEGPVAVRVSIVMPGAGAWDQTLWSVGRVGDLVAACLVGPVIRRPGQVARLTVETPADPAAKAARTMIVVEALSAEGAAGGAET